ncbi:MAG TPA: class I SAM-dependent methyltransferase [Chloroflexota bacterium]
MSEPPTFLRPDVAATFQDRDVAASYGHRPPYPPETFDILTRLICAAPRTVLDLGCGTGFVARPLAPLVDRVDAVDVSAAMIEEGKRLPGGVDPHLTWIVARTEDAALHPPYTLMTAGDSLHWMNWEVVLPRLAKMLSPRGWLAILSVGGKVAVEDEQFHQGAVNLIRRYTTFDEWRPDFDLVTELESRGLFEEHGRAETDAVPFLQSVDEYVESFHARASLSWQRMDSEDAEAFDAALRQLARQRIGDVVQLAVSATIVWGKPLRPSQRDE